ncbi:rhodanese domain-containing protein CG4456-like [Hyalella azteca]|uniref:Rhodanese domain-containing protein CG4456-like n=1 Tax=Hyalella azteca TaxID=294128 RepID=A0A8B7PJW3_HYAAZ|nr:rhodanese domain-containing protein CG4456-like [Hyalella azteca]
MAMMFVSLRRVAVFQNSLPVYFKAVSALKVHSGPPPHPQLLPDIDFTELRDRLEKEDVILIDVRAPSELEKLGAVPDAINLPLRTLGQTILLPKEDFEVRMGIKKPDSDAPIATMCMAGVRARTAQLALIGAGYTNVRRYRGSFEDWLEKGGAVIKPDNDDI